MPHSALLDSLGGLGAHPGLGPEFFQHPVYRLPVDISDDVPRLANPSDAAWQAPFALFPKLGAKSWRDRGDLATIAAQQPVLPAIEAMMARLSPLQRRYLAIVRPFRNRLDLTLFRYVDFSDISEARWHLARATLRLSSYCLRGASASHARAAEPAMRDLAARVGAALGVDAIVDFAVRPCGTTSILEINPPRNEMYQFARQPQPTIVDVRQPMGIENVYSSLGMK